jgi:N-terminal acetyltransferase B complex non-catalytic subunit
MELSQLVQHIKSLRASVVDAVREIGVQLIKISELEGTSDKRKQFVENCTALQTHSEVSLNFWVFGSRFIHSRIKITHEYVLDVGKKVTDSQKKVMEGVGRGIERVCKTPM